jgi:hypothetical protein
MRELCEPQARADKGMFYPLKYFELLGEQPRTSWLRQRGVFFTGFAAATHWELLKLPEGVKMGFSDQYQYFFVLKAGMKPCEALDILKKGPTLLDCVAVTQVALYAALRDRLGDEKFDRVFRRDGPAPLALDRMQMKYPTSFWLEETDEPGQVRHFTGGKQYEIRHPGESSGGFSTVALGADRYLAFGLGEHSERELLQHLAEEHNRPGETTCLYDPHAAFPHLTAEHAVAFRESLFAAFVDKYGSSFLEESWEPETKAERTLAELERVTTEETTVSVEDLELANRGSTNIRVREECLRALEESSLDRVDDVVRRFRDARPLVSINFRVSPPVMVSPPGGARISTRVDIKER